MDEWMDGGHTGKNYVNGWKGGKCMKVWMDQWPDGPLDGHVERYAHTGRWREENGERRMKREERGETGEAILLVL